MSENVSNPYAPYLTPEDEYDPNVERYAILAYDIYKEKVGGLTWDGKPIPQWAEIKAKQRNGWRMSTRMLLQTFLTGQLERFVLRD